VFLVAGLHTGRYVIASFLQEARNATFVVRGVSEVRLVAEEGGEERRREWAVEREGETNADRSLWAVEIMLALKDEGGETSLSGT